MILVVILAMHPFQLPTGSEGSSLLLLYFILFFLVLNCSIRFVRHSFAEFHPRRSPVVARHVRYS
jgi:hypothetical protein